MLRSMDRLAALKLFVRAVETGSFTRAAAEAHLSQPQASRAVAALEAELGARLLQRSTRRLSTTEAGERVYEQALRLLAEESALVEAAAGADREPVGRLRVSGSVVFTELEMAPHVASFLDAYPRVRLDLAASDARVDLVAEGVDMAFRLGALPDSGLTARRLGAYARWLVAAPAVAEALPAVADPAEALQDRCIVFLGTAAAERWRLSRGAGVRELEATGRTSTGSGAVVHRLALLGAGVALLPSFAVADDLAAGRLVRALPDWEGPPVEVHALWTGRVLPRKARAWLDHLGPRLRTDRP